MKFSKTLIEVAEKSPKKYAKRIQRRNKSLLKRLMLLKPYVGKTLGEIPDKVWKSVLPKTHYGCPHCHSGRCRGCIWTSASHRDMNSFYPCINVKFDGINLHELCKIKEKGPRGKVSVEYGFESESLSVDGNSGYYNIHLLNPDAVLNKEEWDKCVRFVNAHIEWAKLPYWGAKYEN